MRKAILTDGPIASTLIKMAGGMIFGLAAMSAFNIVDTWFVSQLGKSELAAMSFIFPIVLLINSIALGLGIGISSVVSRAIGSGDHHKVQRLVTDGLLLAVSIVIVVSIFGILTIRPLFSLLGADGNTLDLINKYMIIWYIGIPFVVIPMAGNNAIRATGDTFTPSIIMIVAVIANLSLDPLFIFGIGPFPKLGISGAALATVIGRFITFTLSLSILGFREKLILLKRPKMHEVLDSWKHIVFVGVPAAIVQIINPLSLGVITRMLAGFSEDVVAGFGAASKVERFILLIPMALSTAMTPFTGQNWGAGKVSRIIKGIRFSGIVSVVWGIIMFVVMLFAARPLTGLFSSGKTVIDSGSSYLKIVSISYGFLGIITLVGHSFSALNKPFHSGVIVLTRAFIIYLPLAFLGSYILQETGIFAATLVTNILGGFIAFLYMIRFLKKKQKNPGIIQTSFTE